MLFSWINSTRLRVYPRLIAGTMSVVLLLNALLGHNWIGVTGQMFGGDFIMLYSSGILFQQSPDKLYDFDRQAMVQQELVAPTKMWGVMPFNYPPYVASVTSLLTRIPLQIAFIIMTTLSIAAVGLSAILISNQLLPLNIAKSSLPAHQVFFIIISSFAFIEGLQMGQNHGFTLLLMTAAVCFSLRKRWFTAGVLAGLLIYKPHFVLGLLIIWLIWRKWNAIIGFGGVAAAWVGIFFLRYGWQPFRDYLTSSTLILKMVYLRGFGGYLEVTPYGMLIDLLPESAWKGIVAFVQVVFFCFSAALAYLAFKQRNKPLDDQIPVYMLAILFPLIVSPHALLHDMLVIAPALALWSRFWPGKGLQQTTIGIYVATFILPVITNYLDVALLALIPVGLTLLLLFQMYNRFMNKQTEFVV